jgi:hypothetical protein
LDKASAEDWKSTQRYGSRSYHLFLLAAVNVLNVADLILTRMSVDSGLAKELNPVAEALGVPGKLILVATASALIFRLRPGALVWPAVALAGVVTYIGLAFVLAMRLAT